MSWDIVLFNSRQIIESVEEIDENKLEPTDFCTVLASRFSDIEKEDDHRNIKGGAFEISYFEDDQKTSNKILSIYGVNGLFEIVLLARQHHWQIFDTSLGEMIDIHHPEVNGYDDFHKYVAQIKKER